MVNRDVAFLKRSVILSTKGNANLLGCDLMNTRNGVEQHRLASLCQSPVLAEPVEPLLRVGIGNGQRFRGPGVIVEMAYLRRVLQVQQGGGFQRPFAPHAMQLTSGTSSQTRRHRQG